MIGARSSPATSASRLSDRLAISVVALSTALVAVMIVLRTVLLDHSPLSDELGLYNPVYMWLTTGRMTYPAHYHHFTMVVHPPTHYLILGSMVKLGVGVERAALILVLVAATLAVDLIVTARLSLCSRLALLGGLAIGGVMFATPAAVRPDWMLAVVWFAGLVALEGARAANWSRWRIGAGSLLLTLASALHYPAVAAVLGIVPFAVWCIRDKGIRRGAETFLPPASAGLLIGVPFLLGFVLPNWDDIQAMTAAVQGQGTPPDAFRRHLDAYAAIAQALGGSGSLIPVWGSIVGPLFRLGVPAGLFCVPALMIVRDLRGLALGAMPHLCFLLFVARGKAAGAVYYTPEVMIYCVTGLALLLHGLSWIIGRLVSRTAAPVAASVAIIGLLTGSLTLDRPVPALGQGSWSLEPLHAGMDVARTAGRWIADGRSRMGAASVDVWYIGGGREVYMTDPILRWRKDLPEDEALARIDMYDFVATVGRQTWETYNRQRQHLTSYYEKNTLDLLGVFLHEGALGFASFVRARQTPLRAVRYYGKRVEVFEEDRTGAYVFVAVVCQLGEFQVRELNAGPVLGLHIPGPTNTHPSAAVANGERRRAVWMFVTTEGEFEGRIRPMVARACRIRDEIPLRRVAEQSARDYLSAAPADTLVRFPRQLPPPAGIVPAAGNLKVVIDGGAGEPARFPLEIRTSGVPWAYAVQIDWHEPELRGSGWAEVELKVGTGEIGVGILNHSGDAFLEQQLVRDDGSEQRVWLWIPSFADAGRIVVRNGSKRGTSTATILGVRVFVSP